MKDMPEQPLEPFLKTLKANTRKLIEGAVEGSVNCFAERGEVMPVIIALTEEDKPKIFKAEHRNQEEKQIVWAFLNLVRIMHPVTILVSEAWYSSIKDKKMEQYIPPSEDPNHKEVAMIQVWDKDRNIMISADITRNPDHLGEFFVRSDTLSQGELKGIGGALQEGDRYQKEEE